MINWKKSVAADLFDEEYIIANLTNGLYYSVQGTIINILKCLPFESIEKPLEFYGDKLSGSEIEEIIIVWNEMINEELISNYESKEISENFQKEFIETAQKSKLSKYADMQDLLALDPIHEVDEEGWPEINAPE